MQIFIKNLQNKTNTYTVNNYDLVSTLKQHIFNKIGIPEQFYYLAYSGHVLENSRSLSDYMIEEMSEIRFNIRVHTNNIFEAEPEINKSKNIIIKI
jgi:hypothetical protein